MVSKWIARFNLWFYRKFRFTGASRSARVVLPNYAERDLAALLASLEQHPGFLYLISKIADEHAIAHDNLQRLIRRPYTATTAEVVEITKWQETEFWTGWLQRQVSNAMRASAKFSQAAPETEFAETQSR